VLLGEIHARERVVSLILKIDPDWLAARIIAGKTPEEVGDEVDAMIDSAMQREGSRILEEMRKMLTATPPIDG
jgi:hypothetical protein